MSFLFRIFIVFFVYSVFSLSVEQGASANPPVSCAFGMEESLFNSRYACWGINPQLEMGVRSGVDVGLKEAHTVVKSMKKTMTRPVVVAVIDTGIDPQHPCVRDNLYFPQDLIVSSTPPTFSTNTLKPFGVDFSQGIGSPSYYPYDFHGHGTHVACLITKVFPAVKLLILKYYNPKASGEANLQYTIKSLEFLASRNDIDIINYSGGGPQQSLEEKVLLEKLTEKKVLVVAAAGNAGANLDLPGQGFFPASYTLPSILSVMGHRKDGLPTTSSNRGMRTVDISAPGDLINSAHVSNFNAFLTGTSQATPYVTGTAALLKCLYPHLTYEEIHYSIVYGKTGNGQLPNVSSGMLSIPGAISTAGSVTKPKAIAFYEQRKQFYEERLRQSQRAIAEEGAPNKIQEKK